MSRGQSAGSGLRSSRYSKICVESKARDRRGQNGTSLGVIANLGCSLVGCLERQQSQVDARPSQQGDLRLQPNMLSGLRPAKGAVLIYSSGSRRSVRTSGPNRFAVADLTPRLQRSDVNHARTLSASRLGDVQRLAEALCSDENVAATAPRIIPQCSDASADAARCACVARIRQPPRHYVGARPRRDAVGVSRQPRRQDPRAAECDQ